MAHATGEWKRIEWSWSVFWAVFLCHALVLVAALGMGSVIGALAARDPDDRLRRSLECMAAMVAAIVFVQVCVLLVLMLDGCVRVSHRGCHSCGHCYGCCTYNSNSDFWFWMYMFRDRDSGHSDWTPSIGGPSGGGKKDDATIALLFLFIGIMVVVSLGLSALTSAMITSSILEAHNRARFSAYCAQPVPTKNL